MLNSTPAINVTAIEVNKPNMTTPKISSMPVTGTTVSTTGPLALSFLIMTIIGAGAVAVAIAIFGASSPVALATIVGVLVEVPIMLTLVKIANSTKGWVKKHFAGT